MPDVQLAMNTKKHASTKLSPYELMYGTEYKAPGIHNLTGDKPSPECSTKALAEEIRYNANGKTEIAKDNLENNAIKMKKYYDKKAKDYELQIGDLVFQKKNFTKGGESKKLAPLYHKLSRIVEARPPTYRVEDISSKERKWIHFNQLKVKKNWPNEDHMTKKRKGAKDSNRDCDQIALNPNVQVDDVNDEDLDPSLPNRAICQVRTGTIELPTERTVDVETDRAEGMPLEATEMGAGPADVADTNGKINDENPENSTTIRSNQMEQIEDKIEGQQQRMLQEQQCQERTEEKGDHQEGDQDVQLR